METNKLKKAALSGLVYRFGERFLAQMISTVVTIILARILLPEEYGLVSLVTIFITIANVFVSYGLGTALVQKIDSDEMDYSTIFWAGLVLSVVLYLVLFLFTPLIGKYYSKEELIPVLRVMALRLPLAAINSVQNAYVSKNLMFKKFFYVTLVGTIASAVIGVAMAYMGFGTWALVGQYISNSCISTVTMFLFIPWRPKLIFSFGRLKALFSFGGKFLASALIGTVYEEVHGLIIGKKYSTVDLSFYSKGKQFPQLIGNNVSTTLKNVMFPIYSKLQNEKDHLKAAVRRSIELSYFILFPLMIGFVVIAENFVKVILTEKWMECVPFLRMFCVVYLFKPLKNINKSAISAIGRVDINLKVEIAEKIVGLSLIIITVNMGVMYLAGCTLVTYSLVAVTDAIINGKILKYPVTEQIKDIMPPLVVSVIMGGIVYALNYLPIANAFVKLLLQVVVGVCVYVGLAFILKLDSLSYVLRSLKGKKAK